MNRRVYARRAAQAGSSCRGSEKPKPGPGLPRPTQESSCVPVSVRSPVADTNTSRSISHAHHVVAQTSLALALLAALAHAGAPEPDAVDHLGAGQAADAHLVYAPVHVSACLGCRLVLTCSYPDADSAHIIAFLLRHPRTFPTKAKQDVADRIQKLGAAVGDARVLWVVGSESHSGFVIARRY